MAEDMIASFVSGFSGIVSGAGVTFLVLRERVNNLIVSNKENKETVNARLAHHDRALQDILERKHCGPCDQLDAERRRHADERHEQMVSWMSTIQKALDGINDLLRQRP